MHEKRSYFDIEEANALVPTLDYFFGQLARIQNEVNALAQQAESLGIQLSFDSQQTSDNNRIRNGLQTKCTDLAREYADIIAEIHELGVTIEDPDLGTVNFFAWIDGDEVVLSWQYGEAEIGHWFKVNEDFMARRPLALIASAPETMPSTH